MDEFTPLHLFDDEPAPAPREEPVMEEATPEAEPTAPEATQEATPVEEIPVEEAAAEEPAPTEPEPSPDAALSAQLEQLNQAQQQLTERMDALNELFSQRILYAAHEEKIVDQMHRELQKYKEDLYAQLLRPILLDIVEVRDSILRMAATYLARPEGEQSIPNKTFSDYSYDLQDILEKNNVEIYHSAGGDAFTPIRQRVIKKIPTADESLHGKVAESLSSGYSYGGKILSPEKISVYIYEKPAENCENVNDEVHENG